MRNAKWVPVSSARPCRICGKPDWCSFTLNDVSMCRRIEGDGCQSHEDKNGMPYFIYGSKKNYCSPRMLLPRHSVQEKMAASDEKLHEIYLKMLLMMPLSYTHRKHLQQRGLNDEFIDRAQYRSFDGRKRREIAEELLNIFAENLASKVPGIFLQSKPTGSYWSLAGVDGILIPIRDAQGRIISISIRADNPSERVGKYILMSSKSHGGPGPGSRIHVPLQAQKISKSVVRITEGILKADIATFLSGVPTIGLNGLNGLQQTFGVLKEWQNECVS